MHSLPVLSGTEVVTALERLGFKQARRKGSHVVLKRGGTGCVVPMHKEIKTGTLAAIIRQAQITRDEFLDALER